MKQYRPVHWFSGQFLEPQHLQEADAFHESRLAAHFRAARPWPWGVAACKIDEAALALGSLVISQAELHFQDGVIAVIRPRREEGNAVAETRSFLQAWSDRRRPLTIYAALGALSSQGDLAGLLPPEDETSSALPSRPGRFLSGDRDDLLVDRQTLPQPTRPDPTAPVRTLYYYVRLFWEEEIQGLADYHLFPILRLKDQGLGPRLDPDWSPPLVRLNASPWMTERARMFETRLAALVGRLAPSRPHGLYQPGAGPAIPLLSAASRTLSEVRFLLEQDEAAPGELFGLLRHGLAAMSACVALAGDRQALEGSRKYDHQAPAASFAGLAEDYAALLTAVLPEICAEAAFSVAENMLVAELAVDCLDVRLEPYLIVTVPEAVETLLAEGLLLSGSPEDLTEALFRARPALHLTPVPAPPGLPEKPGLHYLKPETSGPAWARVRESRKWAFSLLRGPDSFLTALAPLCKVLFLKPAVKAPVAVTPPQTKPQAENGFRTAD